MSESQSRYSIVERLTQTKLDIMTAKSELKEEAKHKEQKVLELQKDFENWNKDVEVDQLRERRNKEKLIEKAQQEFQNTTERLTEKERVYDDKLSAITEALRSIEEISRTSPTIQT